MSQPFHRLVEVCPSGCWEWRGMLYRDGQPPYYGRVKIKGKPYRAHRAAYIAAKGNIPHGMMVCHSCDNTLCCNPDHLWLGTNQDNQRDAVAKGRHSSALITHCKHGHEFTPENTYWRKRGGGRTCRACMKQMAADGYKRRKAGGWL